MSRSSFDQLRPVSLTLDVISDADGSAQLSIGDTTVIASVYGPGPVKARQELADQASLQVTIQPSPTQPPSITDQLMGARVEAAIRSTLLTRLHPRSLIAVTVQPVRIDGSYLEVAVNAVIAALLDASVPMQRTLVAIGGIFVGDDCSHSEEKQGMAVIRQKTDHPVLFDCSASEEECYSKAKPFWMFIDPAVAKMQQSLLTSTSPSTSNSDSISKDLLLDRELLIASQFNHHSPQGYEEIVTAAIPLALQIHSVMWAAFEEKWKRYANGCL